MKFNDVKICVVGGGNWGKNHLNTLDKIGNLGGLVDENQIKNCRKNSLSQDL